MTSDGSRPEPEHLRRGREHDREQKREWRLDARDIELAERPGVEKYGSGRRGFTDIRGRVGRATTG